MKVLSIFALLLAGVYCHAISFPDETAIRASWQSKYATQASAAEFSEIPGSEGTYFVGVVEDNALYIYKRVPQGYLQVAEHSQAYFRAHRSNYLLYSGEQIPLISILYRSQPDSKAYDQIIYVVDDQGKLIQIDTSSIGKWVDMELLEYQKLLPGFSGIKITEDLLFYQGLVINESESTRSSGGKLYAELILKSENQTYVLEVINGGSRKESRSLVKDGRQAYKDGNLTDAENFLSKAIQADPESWDAWAFLAQTLVKKGDYARSIYASNVVIKSNAKTSEKAIAYYSLGFAHELEKNPDEALHYYQKSYELQKSPKTLNAAKRVQASL